MSSGYITQTIALLGSSHDSALLESVGAGALLAGRDHVKCTFPDHDDRDPSARWDPIKRRHFCTCWPRHDKRAGDILDVIARMLGRSLIKAADHARRVADCPCAAMSGRRLPQSVRDV